MTEKTTVISRAEKYLAHLDRLSGGVEPRFLPVESTQRGRTDITVITYANLPAGLHTAFTYGLSRTDHPDWRHGRPELCISVRSDDESWAYAAGHLAERLRGKCPFTYGNTIRFGKPVAPESALDAFVVFAPAVLDRDDCRIDVSPPGQEGQDIIHIAGLYPVHENELRYITDHGLKAFWDNDWDMYDTTRPPAVGGAVV